MKLHYGKFHESEVLTRRQNRETIRVCGASEFVLKRFFDLGDAEKEKIRARGAHLVKVRGSHVAHCVEVVEDDDSVALVYDWVPGTTIMEEIELGRRWREQEVCDFISQIAMGLLTAHQIDPPVVHRDIKPQNIVNHGGRFIIIDFDAAREIVDSEGNVSIIGSTGYSAPEQFIGSAATTADQYGLAATVVHMLSHRHPTEFPLVNLRLDIDGLRISDSLSSMLKRMLEPDASKRFESIEEVRNAAERIGELSPVEHALVPIARLNSIVTHSEVSGVHTFSIGTRKHYRFLVITIAMTLFAFFLVWYSTDLIGLVFGVGTLISSIWFTTRELLGRREVQLVIDDDQVSIEQIGLLRSHVEGELSGVSVVADPLSAIQNAGLRHREQLTFDLSGKKVTVGHHLYPIEANALRDAIRTAISSSSQDLGRDDTEMVVFNNQVTWSRRLFAFVQRDRVLSLSPAKAEAFLQSLPPSFLRKIDALGFRHVGFFRAKAIGLPKVETAVFVNDQNNIMLECRPGVMGCEPGADYHLISATESGLMRYSWSHEHVNTPTADGFYSVPTHGSIERDFEHHRNWIEQFDEGLVLSSVDDRLLISEMYNLTLVSKKTMMIQTVFAVGGLLFLILVLLIGLGLI